MVCTTSVILWLWALQDILRNDFKTGTDKLVWVIVVVVLPIVGAVLYLLIGRKQKRDITAA
ncbi:PLDc N-terminal domain-containing protein [Pontibacter oryzae]